MWNACAVRWWSCWGGAAGWAVAVKNARAQVVLQKSSSSPATLWDTSHHSDAAIPASVRFPQWSHTTSVLILVPAATTYRSSLVRQNGRPVYRSCMYHISSVANLRECCKNSHLMRRVSLGTFHCAVTDVRFGDADSTRPQLCQPFRDDSAAVRGTRSQRSGRHLTEVFAVVACPAAPLLRSLHHGTLTPPHPPNADASVPGRGSASWRCRTRRVRVAGASAPPALHARTHRGCVRSRRHRRRHVRPG